jgi:hypothetical protein
MQKAVVNVARRTARRTAWWRILLGSLAAVIGCIALGGVLVRHEPAFLAAAPSTEGAAVERAAARMVTKASALYAATRRPGAWDGSITADEVNAWLSTDLPRNHRRLLPRGLTAPRVQFRPQRMAAGAWLGSGMLSTFAWVDLEVRLRGVNQLGLMLHEARLGLVPLPKAAVLRQIALRLEAAGAVTELRRLDDGHVLVVSLPSSFGSAAVRVQLESLQFDTAEMLVAGATSN